MAQDKTVKELQSTATRTGKDDTSKKSNKAWKIGGNFSFNLGQGGSRNWAAGAEKFSLAVAAYANLYANRRKGKWRGTIHSIWVMHWSTLRHRVLEKMMIKSIFFKNWQGSKREAQRFSRR